jgi:hypothetical protein
MAALAEAPPQAVSPAAVGCHRYGCVARGTACDRCLRDGTTNGHAVLTDGQASFILRTKLAHACVEGEGFDSAWAFATAAIVASAPQGQARSWRRALEAVRDEYAEAYRRKRVRLATRAPAL